MPACVTFGRKRPRAKLSMSATDPQDPQPLLAPDSPEDAAVAREAATWSPTTAAEVQSGWQATPPAPPPQAVALLPRGVGEVVDTAIALYREHWKLLLGTAACVMVPVEFLSAFLNRDAFSRLQDGFSVLQNGSIVSSRGNPVGMLGSLLLLVASPLVNAAVALGAASAYMGRSTSVGQVWKSTVRRFWSIIGLGILRSILLFFGFLFFLVPGVFLYIKLQPCTPALMVEDAGPVGALERGWRLTGRNWWRTAGVVVLRLVIYGFVVLLVQIPAFVLVFVTRGMGWILLGVGSSLSSIVAGTFGIVVSVVLYFDLRIRKEAFDLALVAQQVMASPPAVS